MKDFYEMQLDSVYSIASEATVQARKAFDATMQARITVGELATHKQKLDAINEAEQELEKAAELVNKLKKEYLNG